MTCSPCATPSRPLTAEIGRIVAERQDLRAAGADFELLEENRRRLAPAQSQLSLLLIERYLPVAPVRLDGDRRPDSGEHRSGRFRRPNLDQGACSGGSQGLLRQPRVAGGRVEARGHERTRTSSTSRARASGSSPSRDGAINVTEGGGDADATISTSGETFEKIVAGEQNPTTAYMTGKLKIKGDMGAAMKLQKIF